MYEAYQRSMPCVTFSTVSETHPDLPFVICSRVAEFHELSVTLPLSMKVLALPLTDEQIMRYLDKSDQLTALRTIVTTDADLREVLRTPLLLSKEWQKSRVEEISNVVDVAGMCAFG